ncbi:sugar ABC transporter substrate-binding protein [Rhizobium sp. 16-449-1b]|uniref:sugar ABC transporter substrate-binding protein n=1 Tax=Rhizobium sp. 16-449-1b TaxID=2819989 RepID=UPI001AD9E9F6|nr:sugar ABC transporter substrate-binding protein [Rhizobium sp. 16-449-1b]MBO9195911.1 sugar ABC transporter substrate-binding protein [Rhizobium sp. 16-449-1b]
MMKSSIVRRSLLAVTALAMMGGIARAEDVSIDVGLEKPIVVKKGGLKRIALFIEMATNTAVQSTVTGAKEAAARHGIEVDVFDARFDIGRQVNQMQNALVGGYDAWIVAAIEGEQVCNMAASDAPNAGVPVAVVSMAICGRSTNEGEQMWAPGTLTYIGGNESPNSFKRVMQQMVVDHPGPQKIAALTGQPLHPITLAFDKALKEFLTENPQVTLVAEHRTDYSPEQCQQKVQTTLQATPDLSAIIGVYTNMSKGAVPAVDAAGLAGKVRLYEAGGTVWSVDALKSGAISATTGYYRGTAADTAVEALVKAFNGETVPRAVMNDGHPLIEGQQAGQVGIVTAANVDQYTPQSP